MEKTLANIYSDEEVQYKIKILKNKNPNDEQMLEIWDKSLDTLEVLMCKLGLKAQFDSVMDQYQSER